MNHFAELGGAWWLLLKLFRGTLLWELWCLLPRGLIKTSFTSSLSSLLLLLRSTRFKPTRSAIPKSAVPILLSWSCGTITLDLDLQFTWNNKSYLCMRLLISSIIIILPRLLSIRLPLKHWPTLRYTTPHQPRGWEIGPNFFVLKNSTNHKSWNLVTPGLVCVARAPCPYAVTEPWNSRYTALFCPPRAILLAVAMTHSAFVILCFLFGLESLVAGNHCYNSYADAFQSCNACTAGENCPWYPPSCLHAMAPNASSIYVGALQTSRQSTCVTTCSLATPLHDRYFIAKLTGSFAQVRTTHPQY